MDFNTYQNLSRQTAIYPRLGNNLEYPTLGLVDELGEVFEASSPEDVAKEISDVCWYLAQICTEFEFNLQELSERHFISSVSIPRNLVVHTEESSKFLAFLYSAKLAGRVKKIQRDYDGVCPEAMVPVVKEYIQGVLYALMKMIYDLTDYNISQILQMNIDKLFDRKERNVLKGEGDNR